MTVPFSHRECNLAYQVPREKAGDYIGRAVLERQRAELDAGRCPFAMVMIGMTLGGNPIDDYAPDFWLVSDADGGDPIGYLTSPWHSPELGCNIALGYVPAGKSAVGTELTVWLAGRIRERAGPTGPRTGVRGSLPPLREPQRPRGGARPGPGRDGLGARIREEVRPAAIRLSYQRCGWARSSEHSRRFYFFSTNFFCGQPVAELVRAPHRALGQVRQRLQARSCPAVQVAERRRQTVRPLARVYGLQIRPVRRSSLRWLRTLSCSK